MEIAHHKNVISKDGFTLTELLIVLAILSILLAIAIPSYLGYISSTKRTEAKLNLQSLKLLLEQYFSENARYCPVNSTDYTYMENDSGTPTCTTCITSFLPGFKPKSTTAGSQAVLYHYTVNCSSNTAFLATATPQTARGAPSGNLTINQDGVKTGW